MSRWFRFYDEVLDDPKVQRLSDTLYRRWTDLLQIACRNDGVISGDMDGLAFVIRQPVAKVRAAVAALVAAGLLDRIGDDYTPHGWQDRQYASDSSAERMRRHRNKKRDADVTSQVTAGDANGDGTEQSRADHIRTDSSPPSACARVIQAFDQARVDAFGPDQARPWPHQTDGIEAQRWLDSGADEALIAAVFAAGMGRKRAKGEGPPNSLSWFTQQIADALAAKNRPMPQGQPPPVRAQDSQLQAALAEIRRKTGT